MLKKGFLWSKQAPQAWSENIHAYFTTHGF